MEAYPQSFCYGTLKSSINRIKIANIYKIVPPTITQPAMSKYLVTMGGKNSLSTGRDLWHNQTQGGATICYAWLGEGRKIGQKIKYRREPELNC